MHRPVEPSQYTSWGLGRRLRAAGLLGSIGSVGDAYDNAMAESFFGTLQLELLDQHHWSTRRQLALAIFEWIEAWYNPRRRHTSIGSLSRIDYEALHTPRRSCGMINPQKPSGKPGDGQRRLWLVLGSSVDEGQDRYEGAA